MIEHLKNMSVFKRILFLLLFWILCLVGYIIIITCSLFYVISGNIGAWHVMVATDRLLNASLGGRSEETLSSRAYRGSIAGITHWCLLCKLLDIIETDHCKKSEGI